MIEFCSNICLAEEPTYWCEPIIIALNNSYNEADNKNLIVIADGCYP